MKRFIPVYGSGSVSVRHPGLTCSYNYSRSAPGFWRRILISLHSYAKDYGNYNYTVGFKFFVLSHPTHFALAPPLHKTQVKYKISSIFVRMPNTNRA